MIAASDATGTTVPISAPASSGDTVERDSIAEAFAASDLGGERASEEDDFLAMLLGGNEGPLSEADIERRQVGSSGSINYQLGAGEDLLLRYAFISQRGYYPNEPHKANQDGFSVLPNFNGVKGHMLLGVYDGHGEVGDYCSRFLTENMPSEVVRQLKKNKQNAKIALRDSLVALNEQMHAQKDFDDTHSGTTAVVVLLHGTVLTVANVGDSRALIGSRRGKRVVAVPLSSDQTPHRRDERERVKLAGARILTAGMAEGVTKYSRAWEEKLGSQAASGGDNDGDPPRIYERDPMYGPGVTCTRSLGDQAAEHLGVYAEPELVIKQLREPDQFLIVASDGVWEFLDSQQVCKMVAQFTDPWEAVQAVIAESYRLWLQFDVRTDDITMILAFVDSAAHGKAPRAPGAEEIARLDALVQAGMDPSATDATSGVSLGLSIVGASVEEMRPVRRALSREMRKQMQIDASRNGGGKADEELGAWEPVHFRKSAEDVKRIAAAVRANALFDRLSDAQRELVYSCMRETRVKRGDVVVREGDRGDWFYVVDAGTFAVTIGSPPVKILTYEPHPNGGANPCFGELALLYSRPRAASVVATSDGRLWGLDRRSFRAILVKTSEAEVLRTLRRVQVCSRPARSRPPARGLARPPSCPPRMLPAGVQEPHRQPAAPPR